MSLYPILAVLVGALTAIQSRINGQLSKELHNGIAAAVVSFGSGWIILWIIAIVSKKERDGLKAVWNSLKYKNLRRWEIIGGMGGGFYVAVQSTTVPIIGVALFSIATLAGQTVSSLLVDKIGLSPNGRQAITTFRLFAAATTMLAVTIAVFPDLGKGSFDFVALTAGFIVGMIVSGQQAINGRVNEITKRPLSTAWINFLMGTIVLVTALVIETMHGKTIGAFPHNPILYLGGTAGLIFIAVSAFVVKHMGILNFIVYNVAGQLTGAVILDWLVPASDQEVNLMTLIGVGVAIFGIFVTRSFSRFSIDD